MPMNHHIKIQSFLEHHQHTLLWILCLLAMLRIFFFSAAFPFFNNVDEQQHFDTVVKYSKGYLPRQGAANYEYESAKSIIMYGSPEYFNRNAAPVSSPLWSVDRNQQSPSANEQLENFINKETSQLMQTNNYEAFSPPVYYMLAGTWYNLLKRLDFKDGNLLYGIRFLNILLYGVLFWLTYLFCKNADRNNLEMQFGVLLLLSFFPQDVFYSINSDVLSPLLFLGSLYLLIKISNSHRSSLFHFIAGIFVAAAFLTKFTNMPLLILFAIFIIIKIKTLMKGDRLRAQSSNILLLVSGCFLPIICWFGWNHFVLADMTGNAMKLHHHGMSVKSFAEMWDHPIFTVNGVIIFIGELLKTFWRGEFVWESRRIASIETDFFYVISTCIFIPVSIINTIAFRKDYSPERRSLHYLCALVLFLYILLLAVLSMMFDFGTSLFPSREYPFFTNARLMLGAFIPFLILYWDGLRVIVNRISTRIHPLIIVALICIFILYSEMDMTYPVLKSHYNWFHIH